MHIPCTTDQRAIGICRRKGAHLGDGVADAHAEDTEERALLLRLRDVAADLGLYTIEVIALAVGEHKETGGHGVGRAAAECGGECVLHLRAAVVRDHPVDVVRGSLHMRGGVGHRARPERALVRAERDEVERGAGDRE